MDLTQFQELGQSIWLDYLRRNLIASGDLARMVREDNIRGITTNPDIFNKAIADSSDYDAALEREESKPASAIYERLVIDDIQRAADVLHPVFEATRGRDGFVSMEVSPLLAHDTNATMNEARRLWRSLGRDNVMIKVPGTPEGFPAVEQLTREGVNVNITLLFGRKACRAVHDAYMAGLEARVAAGEPIDTIASVASMFVSRVDVLVEQLLHDRLAAATGAERTELSGLLGAVGIANAKLAYEDWKQVIVSPRWQALAARGARPQRMLWASTSTKSPELSDVHYVEALMGPDTIDTMPPKTLDAVRDHGVADDRLEQGLADASDVMAALARFGISMDELADRLVREGIEKFSAAFNSLLAAVEHKHARISGAAHEGVRSSPP